MRAALRRAQSQIPRRPLRFGFVRERIQIHFKPFQCVFDDSCGFQRLVQPSELKSERGCSENPSRRFICQFANEYWLRRRRKITRRDGPFSFGLAPDVNIQTRTGKHSRLRFSVSEFAEGAGEFIESERIASAGKLDFHGALEIQARCLQKLSCNSELACAHWRETKRRVAVFVLPLQQQIKSLGQFSAHRVIPVFSLLRGDAGSAA